MFSKQILLKIFIGIAALGALDAGYLTYEHYAGGIPPCTISGCETVLTSSYATLAGIPISLLGFLFYFSMIVAAGFLLKKEQRFIKLFIILSTSAGFLFSSYLFYLQAQVLGAFCQYCLVSFGTSTLLFILTLILVLKKKENTPILTS